MQLNLIARSSTYNTRDWISEPSLAGEVVLEAVGWILRRLAHWGFEWLASHMYMGLAFTPAADTCPVRAIAGGIVGP